MKTLILLFVLALSSVFAADGNPEGPGKVQSNEAVDLAMDKPKNIGDTEKILDERILTINKTFESHSKLLGMKLKVLPERTVAYKGKRKGDDCEFVSKQENPGNDCIKIESYDFVGENGVIEGSKNKSITLFFEGGKKVAGIKSKLQTHNVKRIDHQLMEIIDYDPTTQASHDDKIMISFQIDGYPVIGREETSSEKGVGKYKIANVENSATNPLRNEFKQDAYIKHLLYFERLLSKIFNFNDINNNKNYKEHKEFLNSSLNY